MQAEIPEGTLGSDRKFYMMKPKGKLIAVEGATLSCPNSMVLGMPTSNFLISTSDIETCCCNDSILTINDDGVGINIRSFQGCSLTPDKRCTPIPHTIPYIYSDTAWKKAAEPFGDIDEQILTEESYFICANSGMTRVSIDDPGQEDLRVGDEFDVFLEIGTVFKIHPDGSIEKIIYTDDDTVTYIFSDGQGNAYNIGTATFNTIGGYNLIDIRDIGQFSANGGIDGMDMITFSEGGIGFSLTMNTASGRYFMNDETTASLLGAMLTVGYDDIVFNGFSDEHGHSIGGSTSHVNGLNGDFRYLANDGSGANIHLDKPGNPNGLYGYNQLDVNRQEAFINALYLYGWKDMLAWPIDGQGTLLPHTKKFSNHHHHLHVQGYDPDIETTDLRPST